MRKIILSTDYEGLRRQAGAMRMIIECMEKTRNTGAKYEIAKLKGQLESEREMNAILTNENELLRAKIALLTLI